MTTLEKTSATPVVREQNLALRVMRLSNPQFNTPVCLGRDPADPFSVAICDSILRTSGQTSVDIPIDYFLIAPHAMSDVFLGESFAFYISIINVSTYTCKELSLKVDIQTQNQRIALGEMAFSGVSLSQNQQIGQIFKHEIQELGQHILVCTVSYQSMMGGLGPEAMNLRKFFKFPVTKLLDIVSQKFYELEDGSAVLEVQLRNLSPSPVFIERISVSNDLIIPMSRIKQNESDQLSPKALRQYLFRLPRPDQQPSIIGPLEVRWRRSMGERGRIRCEVVQRMIPKRGDLHLTIEQNPKQVSLHQPFSVLFRLRNCSDRSLDLVLSLISELPPTTSSEEEEEQEPPLAPIIHCSVSGQRLQMILPNQTLEFSLDLLAIQPGLQYISGIRLTDTLTKKTYEFDDVTQVFVFQ